MVQAKIAGMNTKLLSANEIFKVLATLQPDAEHCDHDFVSLNLVFCSINE
jgi:hypothetical protein